MVMLDTQNAPKTATAPSLTERTGQGAQAGMTDLTEQLRLQLQVPVADRDFDWEDRFFVNLTQSQVRVLNPEPIAGPDGWPYLAVATDPSEIGTVDQVQKLLAWLAQKGVGLVVNPGQEYPDFVFTYGMIWLFRQTGRFYLRAEQVPPGEAILGAGAKFGDPDEKYLPQSVRKILADFFRDQGLYNVKILAIAQERHMDLAFSLESLGQPPQAEHQGILEALSWFLPGHYSLVLASEKDLPPFFNLAKS